MPSATPLATTSGMAASGCPQPPAMSGRNTSDDSAASWSSSASLSSPATTCRRVEGAVEGQGWVHCTG